MITVTNTAPTNTLTPLASPVVDSAQTIQTSAQGTVSQEDFSSALNGQLNLATPSAASAEVTNAALLAATEGLASTVASAVTLSVDTPAVDAIAIVDPAAMSEKDTAILSTVTDTLKFIASGAKLGDTLTAGQTIQLPSVNLSSTLTQQTVQSAVNQAVTQTPITTSADILAKQVTPIQIATSTTVDTESSKASALVLDAINIANEQNVGLNRISTSNSVQTAGLLQDNVLSNTVQNQNVAQQNTDQSDNTSAALIIQKNITRANNAILTTQQAIAAQQITSDQVTAQTAVDAQASSQEKTLTEAALLQGIATQQTPVETKTTQVTQQQLAIKQNTVALTQNPVLTAPTQQDTLNQAVVAQSVQTTIENTALVASQQTAQSIANNAIQNPQIETSPKAVKTPVSIATDVVNSSDLTGENLNGSLEITIETPLLVDAQLSDSSAVVSDQNAQQVVVDATLLPDTLVTMQVTPQVVAQDVPVDQTESDIVFDKGSDSSNTGDRITTLTSAKTLLMDAVANRNNSGDAGNGNHSSNTPQNSSLSNDTSLNQSIDNKQNIDAKSFATLLSAEKADVISVSSADKATPQAVNAVVNKLAQDVKSADVAPLTRPLSHPQWNEDLGERIVWMNSRGISSAEIKMNPEHMGPITVRIDMNQDQATIAFTAQNSVVRDALEASLPKLREMLSAQQVNLADVSVSQQSTSNSDSGRSAFAQATADMSNGQGNRQNTPEVDSEGNLIASNATNETVDEFENGQVISTNGTNGLLSLYA